LENEPEVVALMSNRVWTTYSALDQQLKACLGMLTASKIASFRFVINARLKPTMNADLARDI
jgi:hypothetical protein